MPPAEVHRDDRLARRVLEGGAVAAPLVLGAEPRAHLRHHQRELWAASHAEDGACRRRRADRRAEAVLLAASRDSSVCFRRAARRRRGAARRDAARDAARRTARRGRGRASRRSPTCHAVRRAQRVRHPRQVVREHVEDRRAQEAECRAEAVAARRDVVVEVAQAAEPRGVKGRLVRARGKYGVDLLGRRRPRRASPASGGEGDRQPVLVSRVYASTATPPTPARRGRRALRAPDPNRWRRANDCRCISLPPPPVWIVVVCTHARSWKKNLGGREPRALALSSCTNPSTLVLRTVSRGL